MILYKTPSHTCRQQRVHHFQQVCLLPYRATLELTSTHVPPLLCVIPLYSPSIIASSHRCIAGKFPKSVCTSVNECVCHGIPDDRPLQEGDIVNVDVTVFLDGHHGDTSRMYYVGE